MKTVVKLLEKIIDIVEMFFLSAIVVVIGWQIFSRTVFNKPLDFPEELSQFLFIAIVFLGTSVVERHNEHIRVEFLFTRMPRKVQAAIQFVAKICTFLIVLAILNGERQLFPRIFALKTRAAGIPYTWIHTIIVISCLFWMISLIFTLTHDLLKRSKEL